MEKYFQPGQHPDADQISAFIEKALSEHERLETLAHLAECERCRSVVFLAQAEFMQEVPEAEKATSWRSFWFRPLPLAGLAAACLFLVVLSLGVHRALEVRKSGSYEAQSQPGPSLPKPSHQSVVDQPKVQTPEHIRSKESSSRLSHAHPTEAHDNRPAPQNRDQQTAGNPAGTGNGVAGGVLGGIGSAPSNTDGNPITARSTLPQSALPDQGQGAAQRAAAPAPKRKLPSESVAQVPINGRNLAAVTVANGQLHLTVEHGRGKNDGLSEVTGTVRDASGAVIPHASISLRGLSGQPATATSTDAQGDFRVPALAAGQYEIQVASAGFQPLTQRVELQPRDVAQIAPVLPVGATSETVDVAAGVVSLQTETAEASGSEPKVADTHFVSQMAINEVALAFNAKGELYRKEVGKKDWKRVKPKWHGTVAQLTLDSGNDPDTTPGATDSTHPAFLIGTSTGEIWMSPDGRHWKKR